jgi:hypothetical protein
MVLNILFSSSRLLRRDGAAAKVKRVRQQKNAVWIADRIRGGSGCGMDANGCRIFDLLWIVANSLCCFRM